VQVYLEPGEAVVTGAAELVTTVLDVVHNEIDIADRRRVGRGAHARPPDLRHHAACQFARPGPQRVMVAGRTCLAGDVFGDTGSRPRSQVGDEVRFADAAGYTMVKTTWFNGLRMPSIVVRRLDGTVETVRQFTYEDFERSLS
jgi:carboxynorspermidine decarboxylase